MNNLTNEYTMSASTSRISYAVNSYDLICKCLLLLGYKNIPL